MSGNKAPKGSLQSVLWSAFAVLFMLYWNYGVITGGAPVIMWVFGLIGLLAVTGSFLDAVKEYRKRKLNEDVYDYNRKSEEYRNYDESLSYSDNGYCPHCGAKIKNDFIYCPYCGRQLNY